MRKDGSVFPVEVSTKIVDFGNGKKVVAYVHDITYRKLAEDRLRDSEEMLRAIFDTAMDAIIAIDDKGLVTHFNAAAEEMFGQKAEDIIGKALDPLMPEEFIKNHHECVPSFFATGKPDGAKPYPSCLASQPGRGRGRGFKPATWRRAGCGGVGQWRCGSRVRGQSETRQRSPAFWLG